MERRKFEESFHDAFKNAEVNPSDTVWTNIELDLEKASGDKMKRRLVFFKMLAAASVIFGLCVAGIGYYIFSGASSDGNLAQRNNSNRNHASELANEEQKRLQNQTNDGKENTSTNKDVVVDPLADSEKQSSSTIEADRVQDPADSDIDSRQNERNELNGKESATSENLTAQHNGSDPLNQISTPENSTSVKAFANSDNSQNATKLNDRIDGSSPKGRNGIALAPVVDRQKGSERELPPFYEPKNPELNMATSVADPGLLLLAQLADEEKKYSNEEKIRVDKSEKLWTAVGFAAGGFNANNPTVSAPPSNSLLAASTTNTATKQSQASGVAYSVGVSVGTKLSDRWVLQGGINYLTQSSDYTANSVVVLDNNYGTPKAESLNAFASQTLDVSAQPKVAQTFPYSVNNDVRFMSVPLQAGYLVVDRKFGFQVNAGVSTDLFLQNTITPDGGGVSKTTQGRGDESPYRSLNFSGLMGTELSYKLGQRYRVSLNPGLRYPFSSVYKSNTGVDSTPLTFDVGLRFRYIFH